MFRHSKSLIVFTSLAALTLSACGGEIESSTPNAAAQDLAQSSSTIELVAIQDSRTQLPSGDVNFGSAQLWINTQSSHFSFVEFDTSVLPTDAEIESAELVLHFTGHYDGDHAVEIGRVDADWQEGTITWNNQPAVTWGGPQQVVGDDAADVRWDVTSYVAAWHEGSAANEGLALRGAVNGPGKIFHSKDTSTLFAPRLVVKYRVPECTGPLPELGDAPDSTNHHGIVNTAYAGVPGQFPTVWNVPIGQAAGPRHDNVSLEGLLGNFITREIEADLGPDQDGPNNILRNAAGMLGDVANLDLADDGWRNRNIRFFNCQQQTLEVRVSKPATSTLDVMYLNVWFDGSRDAAWDDTAPCVPPGGGGPQPSFEWIVQNFAVNMAAIPSGGFSDLMVDTERVLNLTEGMPHWMRFTLSERPAVQPPMAGALPDGRGPHPKGPIGSFDFGETEDVFQLPPPPGTPGELVLEKRVLDAEGLVEQGGTVRYQIRLRHEGGTAPTPALIRDVLPLPVQQIHLLTLPQVTSATGGAAPLTAVPVFEAGAHGVLWNGILAPDSEVTLEFTTHVHPSCLAFQATKTITNVATVTSPAGQLSATAPFQADCPGSIVAAPHTIPLLQDLALPQP